MKNHIFPILLIVWICAFFTTATAQTENVSLQVPGALPVAQPTPAQSQSAPAQSIVGILNDKVKLDKGDRLSYRVAEDRNEPVLLTVNDAGDVNIPLLGHIRAAGKTCKEIAEEIKPLLEKDYYYKATIIIGLETHSERSVGKVYVMGQVRLPGGQEIPAGEVLSVSKVIARAQGFADFADKANVRVIRKSEQGKSEMMIVDVGEIVSKGLLDKDPLIQPNDTVIVPEVKQFHSKVYVLGRVHLPTGLDLEENEKITVSKAIARAQGFAEFADKERVKLLRKNVVLPWFTVEDVVNPFGLANKMVASPDLLSTYLRSLFSKESLVVLADPKATKQQQKFVLVEELNKAIQGVLMYEDQRFSGIKLSSDALRLKALNPKNEDLIRLNRMLLEDVYMQELRRNRPPEYQMFVVNIAEILDKGLVDKDPVMEANDLVIVPESKRTYSKVSVMGQVHYPQTIEMLAGGNLTVSQVIAKSGGFSDFANKRKLKLLRKNGLDSYLFTTDDILKVRNLVRKLQAHEDPLSLYLWGQFTESARRVLANPRATLGQQQTVLIAELNRILKGASIYSDSSFAQVKLPQEIMLAVVAQNGTYLFTVDDILDVSGLAVKLNAHSDPLFLFLWSQLTDQERKMFASATAASRQLEATLVEPLVAMLNNVIRGSSIYNPQLFDGMEISAEALALMTQNPQGEDVVRLNRLLLEDACPQEIRKNSHNPRDKNLIRLNRRLLEVAYPREIKRHEEYSTIIVDMERIIDKAELDKDPLIEPDDLIIVPERWLNF